MRARTLCLWTLCLIVPALLLADTLANLNRTLKHRDVRGVLARVTEELGPRGQVWVDGGANRITVQDEPSRLQIIGRLLDSLDIAPRRFALASRLDVLPERRASSALFKESPAFVDMTEWAREAAPQATYRCVLDVAEGQGASCDLGKTYRLEVGAEGYDPSRARLALRSFRLTARTGGEAPTVLVDGSAVLPEGSETLFLLNEAKGRPPLRLGVTPSLLPDVTRPEVP